MQFLKFQKRYFKYGLFTVLKYFEYAITAYVTFSIASRVSANEYGEATPAFLIITYSLFGSLGINQVLLKWYSTNSKLVVRNFLIQYTLVYTLLSALIIAIIIYIVLDSLEYRIFVVFICALKLIQESIVNINRVRERILTINVIYLTFSICFIITYSLFVDRMASFFEMWAYSLIISVLVGVISLIRQKWVFKNFNFFQFHLNKHFKVLITDGAKLALVAFITPWFLTIDRVVLINFTGINTSLIGTIQLSDNISSIVTISFSSVIFIFTQQIIEKLHSGIWSVDYVYRKGVYILVIILVLILLALIPINLIIEWFFPQYSGLSYPLSFFLISKTIFIATVIPNLICIAYSRESLYIKISSIYFIFLVSLYFIAKFFFEDNFLFYVYPIILLFTTILLFISYYFSIRSLKIREHG